MAFSYYLRLAIMLNTLIIDRAIPSDNLVSGQFCRIPLIRDVEVRDSIFHHSNQSRRFFSGPQSGRIPL